MIVVDSSVWIEYFRDTPVPEVHRLDTLLETERIVLGDLILCEVLRGLRRPRDVILVEDHLAAFEVVVMGGARVARAAAANYRGLRQLGSTIGSTIDLLIATWCIEHDVPLLHRDRDFDPFEAHLGLRVVRAA